MTTVLVLDAENRNALAAIRSLGRRGVTVVAGSKRRLARGFLSKYSAHSIVYPSPEEHEAGFVTFIQYAVDRFGIDVVLPIGDTSARTLSKHKDMLSRQVAIPVADWRAMRIASDKRETFSLAAEMGVPAPVTYASKRDVRNFPVVVKRSKGTGGVHYVNNVAELACMDASAAVIQEYIPGEGYGFFALFEHGTERAIFMHRRVREYPITGGPSTAAESVHIEDLLESGLALLRALQWHGVAMVEFKKDERDSQYKLMEINPKFWGSLDLSIAAGVDFPWLAVKMALGTLDESVETYRTGVRFHWVFDDLMHLAARPSSFRDVLSDFRNGVANDLCVDDLKPAAFDGVKTIALLLRRVTQGRLRYPHGVPCPSVVSQPRADRSPWEQGAG